MVTSGSKFPQSQAQPTNRNDRNVKLTESNAPDPIQRFARRKGKTRVDAAQIRELQSDERLAGRFVIVDARSKAESDVSIIPGAITKTEFDRTAAEHEGKVIIAYCTIGFRSGLLVRHLKRKGFNAWNYRGSILDWCKNGLPLTTQDGEATQHVHTYSRWLSVPKTYNAVH